MAVLSYVASGGPLDGQTVQSRRPAGFLLVDKPHLRVWPYDVNDHLKQWMMREGSPFVWNDQFWGSNPDHDIRAYDDDR
jgi:hypothetical protein